MTTFKKSVGGYLNDPIQKECWRLGDPVNESSSCTLTYKIKQSPERSRQLPAGPMQSVRTV
jgi:hypothetical protein